MMLLMGVIGSTYAYLTSTTAGGNDAGTGSTGYNISMRITPVYSNFSLIPMDDSDAMKAIGNECKDKYDHGACNAFLIDVYDFDSSIAAVSGSINTTLDNIENLSYMVLENYSGDITGNDDCVTIDNANYCLAKSATLMENEVDMSLGDNYSVLGLSNKYLLLVIWLSNLDERQNDYDIGNYTSEITIFLGGDGGRVSGSISGSLGNYENIQGGSE